MADYFYCSGTVNLFVICCIYSLASNFTFGEELIAETGPTVPLVIEPRTAVSLSSLLGLFKKCTTRQCCQIQCAVGNTRCVDSSLRMGPTSVCGATFTSTPVAGTYCTNSTPFCDYCANSNTLCSGAPACTNTEATGQSCNVPA